MGESRNIKDLNDDELVEASDSTKIQKHGGAIYEQAHSELTRRLMQTMREANESTERHSRVATGFTVVLFFVSFMQLVAGIFALNFSMPVRSILLIGASVVVLWAFWKIEKEFFRN